MERDDPLSQTTRYHNAHLLLSTILCFGGCLFPYELIDWLAKLVCFIERSFTFSFDKNKSLSTWLLSNDGDHWSFNMIKDKLMNHSDFRFDMLHVYWHFNYDEFLKLLTLPHRGVSVHCQPGGGADTTPINNFCILCRKMMKLGTINNCHL